MNFLLPFKGLKAAKSRWSGLGVRREGLVIKILQQNLQTVASVAGWERLFLVTPDPAAVAEFATYQCLTVAGRGLNQDLSQAREMLSDERGLTVLLPDLPLLQAQDIETLLEMTREHSIVLCPDHQDFGTNALALADPSALDFLFEGASFDRHQKACLERRKEFFVLRSEGLSRDCDSLEDLENLCLL
ncbi:MAG: 2-phospho-L-lactate guanylyltransferase [Vulcanimicrobiota bacterium]